MSEPAATWELVSSLTPWAKNPRRNDAAAVEVAKSIERFGFGAPLLVRTADRVVIAGHTRLKAAIRLGMDKVPVRFLDLDPAQAAALALRDNKLGELAEWDDAKLAEVIADLQADGVQVDDLGWSSDELAAMLGGGEAEAEEEAPGVEDGPADSVAGAVYEMGPHRLVCGDSAKAETWAALMGGERWSMLMTSPPYGQQRDYGEAKAHVKDWRGLMAGVFGAAIGHAEPDGQMLVNLGLIHRDRRVVCYWDAWLADMDERGWYLFGWYVWDQGAGLPGTFGGRLMPSHEWVFHLQAGAGEARKTAAKKTENVTVSRGRGLRSGPGDLVPDRHNPGLSLQTHKVPDSVLRLTRAGGDIRSEHPAVFPVHLPATLVPVWTDRGGIVAEPFGGSGTTLIACAETGRVARLIELDPKYCDVIRRRWTRWAREHGQDPGSGALEARADP